jgi:hypothetical protein
MAEAREEIAHSKALMQETGTVLFKNFIDEIDLSHSSDRQISTRTGREDHIA